ncbi:uncharacterized protein LOC124280545 [Haliotis rubra]|uniref:uncharacterized protein LOC124280545 n=1 Tax=Haliotis rubra TaxID=36100 RepID=UPI001EE5C97C|nr:uncharacterized protein LOC124280545 [Haliotis rubra]
MDLRCGSSAISEPLAVDECPVNTTTTTTTTTASTTTPLSHMVSERTSTILRNTSQNWINVLIVVGILLTMMIVFSGILECRSRRQKRANKVHPSGNTQASDHHGLPLYAFGPKPETITQIAPTRGILSPQQSSRQTVHKRTSSSDSVPPELRKFGDTKLQTIPSAGQTLPPVRSPQPPRSVDVPTLSSQSPTVSASAGALNGHVGNNIVVEDAGQSEYMQTERNRKKKKRKKDKTSEDEGRGTEGETRKRKKKKTKKTTDHDAEKEL